MSNREQELAKAAKRSNFDASSDEKSWKEVQKSLKIAHEEAKKEKLTADIRDKMNQFESGKCDREMILSKEIEALRIESERSSLNARMEGTRKKILVQQRSLPAVEEDKKNLSRMASRKDVADKVNGYSVDLKVASDRKWYTLLMEENEELTTQLVKASQEADELKRKNEMLQLHESNTVMQLQSSLSRLQITHRITKGALVEAQASIRTLRQEKKKNLVERQISQEEQPSPVKDQSTDQENRWKQQKRELEKKIAFYVEKSEQYDEKIMDLNMTIGELVLKNEALEEQLASSKPEPTKSGSLDATAAENASAADDSGGSTTKIAKLQQRNETLKIQVDALMFEVESLREKQTYDYAVLQEKENELNNLQRETSEQKKLLKEWEEKEKASKHQEKWQETFNREHQTKIATLTAFYENSLEKVTKEKESLMLQVKLLKESTDKFRENDRKAVLCLGELNRRQKLIEMYHAQMDVLIAENTSLKTMLGDSRHDAKPLCFWDKLMELIMSIISDVVKGCVVVRQGDIQSVLEGLNELTKSLEKTELDLQFSQEANKNLLKEIEKKIHFKGRAHEWPEERLTDLSVVDAVEENHSTDRELEEWSNSSPLGLHVLVLPSPECSAHSPCQCLGALVAPPKPRSQLTQLHLPEWGVSWKENSSGEVT
uniref:Uncharacterized protein n=1 Tax=Lutzomyia longipalpis TaxID=7200 RepID=A0A1B0CFL4_LUTLO